MLFTFEHETELRYAADKAVRRARKELPKLSVEETDENPTDQEVSNVVRTLFYAGLAAAFLTAVGVVTFIIRTFINPN